MVEQDRTKKGLITRVCITNTMEMPREEDGLDSRADR